MCFFFFSASRRMTADSPMSLRGRRALQARMMLPAAAAISASSSCWYSPTRASRSACPHGRQGRVGPQQVVRPFLQQRPLDDARYLLGRDTLGNAELDGPSGRDRPVPRGWLVGVPFILARRCPPATR